MRARLDSPWVTGLFGVVVALITWDYVQITPAPGLDGSWILGLNIAASEGLDHGTQFAFTYGPLGFLDQPMVVDGLLATLGGIWLFGLRVLLAASLLWAARRSFSWPLAALAAFVVAVLIPPTVGSVALALAALWCLLALQADMPAWTSRLLVFGGGALAAVEAMIKLNVGATVLLMVVIAVAGLPGSRLRNLARLGGTFALAFVLLWFAAGQGAGNLDNYVSTSMEIVSGYQRSMQLVDTEVGWDWAAAIAVVGATSAAVLLAGSPATKAARIATPVLLAVLCFSLYKYAFVRHDGGHVSVLFGVLTAAWLVPRWEGDHRLVFAAGLAAMAAIYFPVSGQTFDQTFGPKRAVDQLKTLFVPSERQDASDKAREQLRAYYAVDPAILERIGTAPVDARPWEIGLVWANGLSWDPLPVIQDYSAYTNELDTLNADALADADGPRFVLRHLGYGDSALVGIDGRLTTFDAPLEQLAMLCRFRAVETTAKYQLVERTGEDRCGDERPLETVEADYGETVQIPSAQAGEMVLVRIEGAGGEGIERLRTLAYKEATRFVTLDGTTIPFQSTSAPDGLILSVPPKADYPAPFALAFGPSTIAVDSAGGFATSSGPLTYEFFAEPIEPGS